LNLATRGHLTFQNEEEGHKLDAWVPGLTNPRGFFISPLSVFAEIAHDAYRYLLDKPDAATAAIQIAQNKLGPMGRAALAFGSGRDPFTQEKQIGTWNRIATSAKQLAPVPIIASQVGRLAASKIAPGAVSPPPPGGAERQAIGSILGIKTEPEQSAAAQIYRIAERWKSQQSPELAAQVLQRLKEDYGVSPYRPLRQALAQGDITQAKLAYQELRNSGKIPKVIRNTIEHPHPFTGSAKAEKKFVSELTPHQQELYRQALQERQIQKARFEDLIQLRLQQ
jgi:hypothetical protein